MDGSPRTSDGSPRTAAAQKRARDAVDLTEDARSEKKKVALTAPSDDAVELVLELRCPLTLQLPTVPVMAEDGKIYEEEAIRRWFAEQQETGKPTTSPFTRAVIGTRLVPAVHARNTIEAHVKSGVIDGEAAEAWTKKLAQEKIVKEMRAKAEGDDGEALYWLGAWYEHGENGLAEDEAQARAWYERSAAARDPKGLAEFGFYLLNGIGGPQDNALGLDMVRQAAALGSDVAAYTLGQAFFLGQDGLPKDHAQARVWLEKVVDGEGEDRILEEQYIPIAVRWLRWLDHEELDQLHTQLVRPETNS